MKGAARNPLGIRVAYGAASLVAEIQVAYAMSDFKTFFP